MPIYVYHCRGCRVIFERFMPLALYRNTVLHECAGVGTKMILPPMIAGDLPPYESPIDGRIIHGRRARHEDLKRSGCRPYEPGEKEYHERARIRENEALDRRVGETVEREIALMPARKKEILEQEVRAGASCEVTRSTP